MSLDLEDIGWFVADTVIMGLSLLFFALSSIKDPGYLKKPTKVSFLVHYLPIFSSSFLSLATYAEFRPCTSLS
jgi:hypothetical protein